MPKIAAVVLAAGLARRMGRNKLLLKSERRPLISFCVDALLQSQVAEIWVVTGNQRKDIEQSLAGRAVNFKHCPDYEQGMGASLSRGVSALRSELDGVLVCLGDMPFLSAAVIDAIIDKFAETDCHAIVTPVYAGRSGHPVLFPQDLFSSLRGLSGDVGARQVLRQHAERLETLAVESDSVLQDIDDPQGACAAGFSID